MEDLFQGFGSPGMTLFSFARAPNIPGFTSGSVKEALS